MVGMRLFGCDGVDQRRRDRTDPRPGPAFQLSGGSLPCRVCALRRLGEWNEYEITANGPRIKVVLNGQTIVNGDMSTVKDPEILRVHYGMLRPKGHIALLGHWSHVEFRNIRIKELE